MMRRGVTLVELMVSMLLVFSAGLTLALVVASSSRYMLRQQYRTMALQSNWSQSLSLANSVNGIQSYLRFAPPLPSITPSYSWQTWGNGKPPVNVNCGASPQVLNGMDRCYFADTGGLAPSDGISMTSIEESPKGPFPLVGGQFIKNFHVLRDVTVSGNGQFVFFCGNPPYNFVYVYNVASSSVVQRLPLVGVVLSSLDPCAAPGVMQPSGLLVDQGATVLEADDSQYLGFHNMANPTSTPAVWGGGHPDLPSLPDGGGRTNGYPAGLASDGKLSTIWCVDSYIRGLWSYQGGGWQGPYMPAPPIPPLLFPAQLAWDTPNNVLWMTDQGDVCLRSYAPGGGWSPLLLRGPTMGSPRGVAVDNLGMVYTADTQSLWLYSPASNAWKSVALPPGLQYAVNSMHFDLNHNLLWIDTDGSSAGQPAGQSAVALWMFNPVSSTFSQAVQVDSPNGYPSHAPCLPGYPCVPGDNPCP